MPPAPAIASLTCLLRRSAIRCSIVAAALLALFAFAGASTPH
jgi:hypothetical protein